MSQILNDFDEQTLTREKVEPPKRYNVLLLNDDYTPMEFVILVLEQIFGKSRSQAVQLMMHIHTNGKGVCGTYSHEIAEAKVGLVEGTAKKYGFPLKAVMEEE